MRKKEFCVITLVLLLTTTTASAQVTFTDVAEAAGLGDLGWNDGICATWGDYDNDGYADMALSGLGFKNGQQPGRKLYHNEGDGTFADVTLESGTTEIGSNTAIFLDFDNDGHLDMFIGGQNSSLGDLLYRNNGDGTFTDVSRSAGMIEESRDKPCCMDCEAVAFDYNNDGFIDIFTENYGTVPSLPNFLYRNEGNGRFTEVAREVNLDGSGINNVVLGDYDNDRDMDLYISVFGSDGLIFSPDPDDLGTDMLYRNEGDGMFVDVAPEAGVGTQGNYSSGFFWDYDNDGDLDLFVRSLQFGDVYGYNMLYRNNGNSTFTEVAEQAGIMRLDQYTLGMDHGDYDNDGWLDLYITYQEGAFTGAMPMQLYQNNRDGTFTDVSRGTGLSGHKGGGMISFVDYDSDGDLDLFSGAGMVAPLLLYRNNGTLNHWLQLKLVGRESNRDAIGARIEVRSGELSMIREVAGGNYVQHAEYLPTHFGLGGNTKADVVNVRWPSGITQTFTDVLADQRLTIDEYDGIVTVVRRVLPRWGHPAGGTTVLIEGERFLPGSRVLFDGVEAGNVSVESVSLITAATPPGERGSVDVEVVHPDTGTSVLSNGFRYTSIQVSGVTPDNGPTAGGIPIQIEGSGFQQGAEVRVGGKLLDSPSITPSLIRGTLPPGEPGKVGISVANPDGEMFVLKRAFTYILPPTIRTVTPDVVPLTRAGEITIAGNDFDPRSTVQIGGIEANVVTFASSLSLSVVTPSMFETGPKDVVVINPDGQRAVVTDGVTVIAPPRIKSIEPSSGGVDGGAKITIFGEPTVDVQGRAYPSRFVGYMQVFIGDEEAEQVIVESDHVITALTPLNTPGLKDVRVADRFDQSDTLENAFSYNELPQVIRVIPDNGRLAGGTEITIQGSGFLPGAKVFIMTESGTYMTASSVEVVSASIMTAITPAGKPGAKDVVVRNPDKQEAILPEGFTYNPLPTITSITPDYGVSSGGTKVIIEGTGFLQRALVMVGERGATTMVRDDMTIEAVTPANRPGVWDVRVVNPDTQEAVAREGFVSVGQLAYNFPNPFQASRGTTFRYVTDKPVQYINVKIFNMAGIPIDVIQQTGSNEVEWHNPEVHGGLYVYMMEVRLENGNVRQFRNALEVYE